MPQTEKGYKAELGRAAWTFLHVLASKFPENPTLEDKERYMNFMAEFSMVYPCTECRLDFQKILAANPPKVFSSSMVLMKSPGDKQHGLQWMGMLCA